MATLSLREIPTELHGWLKQCAIDHGRSINAEILQILDGARKRDEERRLREEHLASIRARYLPRGGTPAEDLVRMTRQDRSR